eukprot:Sdes_comp15544_c0_seq2m4504
MMRIEDTFVENSRLDETTHKSIVIFDRGCMDASAYISSSVWENILEENQWSEIELRDHRYDQVIHVTTAALGAEKFYELDGNITRSETIEEARSLDEKIAQAWVGHPYLSVVDNRTGFAEKCSRIVRLVCKRLGLKTKDSVGKGRIKRKFLIEQIPAEFPIPTEQFDVRHDYLCIGEDGSQTRLRKRGQQGIYTYMHTIRKAAVDGQIVEIRKSITSREYGILLRQRDPNTNPVYKNRICFLWNNRYYQMDAYSPPFHARCQGLIILETSDDLEEIHGRQEDLVPDFLAMISEVTDQQEYSMYCLAQKK